MKIFTVFLCTLALTGLAETKRKRKMGQENGMPEKGSEVCSKPLESGPCEAAMTRWGYDPEQGTCVTFTYGGCQGNKNNFKMKGRCLKICANSVANNSAVGNKKSQSKICNQALETGPCRAAKTRWGYDPEQGTCVTFTYGGCRGNKNNFQTKRKCLNTCTKKQKQKDVNSKDVCQASMESGPCNKTLARFYFDMTSKSCKRFNYSGCGGNKNRFLSNRACEKYCLVKNSGPSAPKYCGLYKDSGPCRAAVTKWFFDAHTKQCKTFTYGGCKGNQNRFNSERDCLFTCLANKQQKKHVKIPAKKRQRPKYCDLEQESGDCDSAMTRWSFDVNSSTCVKFNYTGCGGNRNRFANKYSCDRVCGTNSYLIYKGVKWLEQMIRMELGSQKKGGAGVSNLSTSNKKKILDIVMKGAQAEGLIKYKNNTTSE